MYIFQPNYLQLVLSLGIDLLQYLSVHGEGAKNVEDKTIRRDYDR